MMQYTDKQFKHFRDIACIIQEESLSQIQKWGVQTHTLFEWLAYTTEELGELAQAIAENEYRGGAREGIVSEAIQVATLALKIAEMADAKENNT